MPNLQRELIVILFFLTETMELRLIHTFFFCPRPFVSLSFPHDYVMSCSNNGWDSRCCLHLKKNVINVFNE